MAALLKQGTTVTVKVGPFLDKTDGVTEETALTPAIEISKNGGAFAARSSTTAVTHDSEGWYNVELNATDTDTVGRLVLKAHDAATHLPVWHEFMVVPANVYDSLVSGSDKLQIDVAEWLGTVPLGLVSQLVQTQANQLGTQAKADVNAEVDNALDTPVPTTPTADSINERIKALDDNYTASRATNLDNLDATVSSRSTYAPNTDLVKLNFAQALDISPNAGSVGSALLNCDQKLDAAVSSRSSFDAATDTVDVGKIAGDANAATQLKNAAGSMESGSVDTSTYTPTTTDFETNLPLKDTDHYKGAVIRFTSGVLSGQKGLEVTGSTTSSNSKTKLTITAASQAPASGDTFELI